MAFLRPILILSFNTEHIPTLWIDIVAYGLTPQGPRWREVNAMNFKTKASTNLKLELTPLYAQRTSTFRKLSCLIVFINPLSIVHCIAVRCLSCSTVITLSYSMVTLRSKKYSLTKTHKNRSDPKD